MAASHRLSECVRVCQSVFSRIIAVDFAEFAGVLRRNDGYFLPTALAYTPVIAIPLKCFLVFLVSLFSV